MVRWEVVTLRQKDEKWNPQMKGNRKSLGYISRIKLYKFCHKNRKCELDLLDKVSRRETLWR